MRSRGTGPAVVTTDAYTLLDLDEGRRLEQWGACRLIRPDVAARGPRRLPASEWEAADARFEGRVGAGRWQGRTPPAWVITHAGLRFEVRCAPSMHVGLFPEQAENWKWMALATARGTTEAAGEEREADPPRLSVLNLFGYTGGASLALAAAGHRVTHVDASRPAIGWARRNAGLNGITTIRWIQEDARTFVARETRRGRVYDALLLDPPAFGHGPAGPWQIERDLPELLAAAIRLLSAGAAFVLLNLYSSGSTTAGAGRTLRAALTAAGRRGRIETAALALRTPDGRTLPTGVVARWTP